MRAVSFALVVAILTGAALTWVVKARAQEDGEQVDEVTYRPIVGGEEGATSVTGDTMSEPQTEPATEIMTESELSGISVKPQLAYWGRGRSRWFISGLLDLGYLYLRPRFQVGYGRPHWQWVGLEVNPLISGAGAGAYAGLRGAIPWAELRVGARYFFTFQSSFLTPAAHYTQLTAQDRTGPSSSYLSLEAQLELRAPLGPGSLRSEITGTYVTLVDPGYYVQEQTLYAIVAPPWIWGANLGYRISFGPANRIYIQPMAEFVHLVNRNEIVVRVGLQVGIQLWPDLEARLFALPQIVGPDDLGAAGAQTFQLGLRWRFATDMPDQDELDQEAREEEAARHSDDAS